MKPLLIAVSALALSSPALAQMEPATPGATTTQSTTNTTQTPPTAPVDQSTTTTESTTATTPSDPKALIASEFPTYDKDASGNLDKPEFAAWMGALKAKTGEKPMAPAEMNKWSDGAFATADKDKSKTVTLVELQAYLTQGA
jgi:Ca2+-binding EF-hand superfamily protein